MTTRQIEVTLKWLAGEMSNPQAAKALGIKTSRNVYWKMGSNARKLFEDKLIKRNRPLKVRGTVS
jgi:hypothetical protein